MRAAVLAVPLVLAATSSQAQGLLLQKMAAPDAMMTLSGQHRFLPQPRADDPPLLGPDPVAPPSANGFSIGPFRAEAAPDFRPGRRAHLSPHYRLDGVSVLGGSVGGSLNGRGGMITLQWHSSP